MTNHNACVNMIKQQLRTGDVLEEHLLDLFQNIPRSAFVPIAMKEFAYSDTQIPLAHSQTMLTPLEEGKILQALDLQGTETILEIGTGSGYLTALLSRLCKKVISVDYFAEFTAQAEVKLHAYDCNNVECITQDASHGWLDNAPYDMVVVTAGCQTIMESYRLQVVPGGKLFAIVGDAPVMRGMLYSLDHHNNWTESMIFETCIPYLITNCNTQKFVF